MCKRVYLTAKEAEKEMQEARKADGFTGKMENNRFRTEKIQCKDFRTLPRCL